MEALLLDDWLSTIHLIGAAQGIFLAVFLASKRRNFAGGGRVSEGALGSTMIEALMSNRA